VTYDFTNNGAGWTDETAAEAAREWRELETGETPMAKPFTAHLSIGAGGAIAEVDCWAVLNERNEVEFYARELVSDEEHRLTPNSDDDLARHVYWSAKAAWDCNPHLETELRDEDWTSRQDRACESEHERRTGYHDVAA